MLLSIGDFYAQRQGNGFNWPKPSTVFAWYARDFLGFRSSITRSGFDFKIGDVSWSAWLAAVSLADPTFVDRMNAANPT